MNPSWCALEDIPCPDLADALKCPGVSCPLHKAHEPTDEEKKYRAFANRRYGEED